MSYPPVLMVAMVAQAQIEAEVVMDIVLARLEVAGELQEFVVQVLEVMLPTVRIYRELLPAQ